MKEQENYKKITEHLEYLGYKIEDLKAKEGHTYIAEAEGKSSLLVRVVNNVTILTIRWSGIQQKALKSKDFFEIINQINQSSMSKWYYQENEDDVTIVTEADYYDYQKSTFGTFVENLNNEVNTGIQLFRKFTKD